jgi:hypothetical protein
MFVVVDGVLGVAAEGPAVAVTGRSGVIAGRLVRRAVFRIGRGLGEGRVLGEG